MMHDSLLNFYTFKKNMPVSQATSPSKTQYLDRAMTEIPHVYMSSYPPNSIPNCKILQT